MQGAVDNSVFKENSFSSSTTMTHSLTELSKSPDNVNSFTSMVYNQNPMLDISSGSANLRFTPFPNSPVIDAGNNASAPNEIYDFTGSRIPYYLGRTNYRIKNNTIDIGAQEYEAPSVLDLILNPMDSIFAANNGSIQGAWTAGNNITVLSGFTTSGLNHMVIDAPEVEIISDYSFMSSNQLNEVV